MFLLGYTCVCKFYTLSDARHVILKMEEYLVHDVSTVLKRYFRNLSDPLLTTNLYTRWVNNAGKYRQNIST